MHPSRSLARASRGFTVLETIIAVVVVTVLSGMAWNSYTELKRKAYIAAMRNDLSVLGTKQEVRRDTTLTYATTFAAQLGSFRASKDIVPSAMSGAERGYVAAVKHTKTRAVCTIRGARGTEKVGRIACDPAPALPVLSSASGTMTVGQAVAFDAARAITAAANGSAGATLGPLQYVLWDYGDGAYDVGSPSMMRQVAHNYTAPGKYRTILYLVDNSGNMLAGDQEFTGVGAPSGAPAYVADFTFSPTPPVVNTPVSFDGTQAQPLAGAAYSYTWMFGDGNAAVGQMATHSYTATGSYNATLTVQDTAGIRVSVTKTVPVGVGANQSPTAAFVFNVTQGSSRAPVTVNASGSSDPDGSIVNYQWTFSGPTITTVTTGGPTLAAVSRQFALVNATLTAALTVTDNAGATGTVTKTLPFGSATGGALVPSLTADRLRAAPNSDIRFIAAENISPNGPIQQIEWNLGDGTLDTRSNRPATAGVMRPDTLVHRYAAPGTYTASIVAVDGAGYRGTASVNVTILTNTPPVAAYTVTPSTGLVGQSMVFDGSNSSDPDGGIRTFAWTFGDATTASIGTVQKTYGSAGTYATSLTVTDLDGATGSASRSVLVHRAPIASFTVNRDTTSIVLPINFNAAASSDPDGDALTGYAWSFGDGQSATGVAPSHTYGDAGVYTAALTVTDARGAQSAPATRSLVVRPNLPPLATYTVSGAAPRYAQVSYAFTSTSVDLDGSVVAWIWSFGDATTAAGPSAAKAYAGSGTFATSLTVQDNSGAFGSSTQTLTVLANSAPVASFTVSGGPSRFTNTTYTFTATSSDADGDAMTHAWAFGDGVTGVGATTLHAYVTAGTFAATVTSTDSRGATGTSTQNLALIANAPPAIGFTVSGGPTRFAQVTYTFTGTYSDPDGDAMTSVGYTFGDATSAATLVATKAYSTGGSFPVQLTVGDARGQSATVTQSVVIRANSAPVAAMNVTPAAPRYTLVPITFTDVSTDADGDAIIARAWDLSNGTTGSGATLTSTFATPSAPGGYPVSLTVTDATGVKATVITNVIVLANPAPTCSFVVSGSTPRFGGRTYTYTGSYSDASGDALASAQWFVDGTLVATGTSASFSTSAGTKLIEYRVTNVIGQTGSCTGSYAYRIDTPPSVSWAITSPAAGPYRTGQALTFSGTVSDADGDAISSLLWEFGDATTASTLAATKTYVTGGSLNVRLSATDVTGSTGSQTQTINITANGAPNVLLTAVDLVSIPSPPGGDTLLVNTAYRFTGSAVDPEGDAIASRTFTVSGVNAGSGVTMDQTFGSTGVIPVAFTACDAGTPSACATITRNFRVIANPAPIVTFTATPASGLRTGDAVTFTPTITDDAASNGLNGIFWDFANGTNQLLSAPLPLPHSTPVTKTYATAGTYVVALSASDRFGASATATRSIVVANNQAPTAVLTATCSSLSGPGRCTRSTAVTLSAAGSSDPEGDALVSYAWDNGAGSTATTASNSWTTSYASKGLFTASVRITDSRGAQSGATTVAVRTNTNPIASFTATPSVPARHVAFHATTYQSTASDPDGDALTGSWDFGDFTGASGMTISKTHGSAGVYSVIHTATDVDGAQGSSAMPINVTANGAPTGSLLIKVNTTTTTSFAQGDSIITAVTSVSDPEGDAVTITWNNEVARGSFANTSRYVIPSADANPYAVRATLADPFGATTVLNGSVSKSAGVSTWTLVKTEGISYNFCTYNDGSKVVSCAYTGNTYDVCQTEFGNCYDGRLAREGTALVELQGIGSCSSTPYQSATPRTVPGYPMSPTTFEYVQASCSLTRNFTPLFGTAGYQHGDYVTITLRELFTDYFDPAGGTVVGGDPYGSGTYIFERINTIRYRIRENGQPFPLSIETTSLPPATFDSTYSTQLTYGGDVGAPTNWSISAGSLPAGMSLTPAGVIQGSPTSPDGTYSFTVRASVGANVATRAMTLLVRTLPEVSGFSVNVDIGSAVYYTVGALRTRNAPTWTLVSGLLPDGLSLAPDGTISGTVTGNDGTGPKTFILRATDGSATGIGGFTLNVTLGGGGGMPYP